MNEGLINSPEEVPTLENEVDVEVTGEDTTTTSNPTPAPTQEELSILCDNIKTAYDFKVDVKPTMFNFKTRKDGTSTTKRDSLELAIPVPSVEGIIAIIEAGGKGLDLLRSCVEQVVTDQARNIISDDLSIGAVNFPVDKISWEAIANMPKAERTGGGIAKEVWEAFAEDYVAVMQVAAAKTLEQATRAASILKGKYSSIKTNKKVITMLNEQLAIYMEATERAPEFANCITFLINKADGLLNANDDDLLDSL